MPTQPVCLWVSETAECLMVCETHGELQPTCLMVCETHGELQPTCLMVCETHGELQPVSVSYGQ